MTRQLLVELAPWGGWILAACVALVVLTKLSRGQFRLSQLAALHRDERGAVQSLSFVLTIPAYVMLLLFIVQLSQLTIAKVVVEYSAFAAARTAQVWIPASLGDGNETANQVAGLTYEGEQVDAQGVRYQTYRVTPGSPKFQRILYAAVMANVAIAPSRSVGVQLPAAAQPGLASLQRAYLAASPAQAGNSKIGTRLRNKLAYAWESTTLEVTIRHRESEPPLQVYDIPPYREEFAPGEIGWHDQLIVKVSHDFALLPGPGRFLARPVAPAGGSMSGGGGTTGVVDRIAPQIKRRGDVYVYSLTATATLHTEGEKPLLPFVQTFAGPLRTAGAAPAMSTAMTARSSESLQTAWSLLPLRPDPWQTEEPCCADPLPIELNSAASASRLGRVLGVPTPARREAQP